MDSEVRESKKLQDRERRGWKVSYTFKVGENFKTSAPKSEVLSIPLNDIYAVLGIKKQQKQEEVQVESKSEESTEPSAQCTKENIIVKIDEPGKSEELMRRETSVFREKAKFLGKRLDGLTRSASAMDFKELQGLKRSDIVKRCKSMGDISEANKQNADEEEFLGIPFLTNSGNFQNREYDTDHWDSMHTAHAHDGMHEWFDERSSYFVGSQVFSLSGIENLDTGNDSSCISWNSFLELSNSSDEEDKEQNSEEISTDGDLLQIIDSSEDSTHKDSFTDDLRKCLLAYRSDRMQERESNTAERSSDSKNGSLRSKSLPCLSQKRTVTPCISINGEKSIEFNEHAAIKSENNYCFISSRSRSLPELRTDQCSVKSNHENLVMGTTSLHGESSTTQIQQENCKSNAVGDELDHGTSLKRYNSWPVLHNEYIVERIIRDKQSCTSGLNSVYSWPSYNHNTLRHEGFLQRKIIEYKEDTAMKEEYVDEKLLDSSGSCLFDQHNKRLLPSYEKLCWEEITFNGNGAAYPFQTGNAYYSVESRNGKQVERSRSLCLFENNVEAPLKEMYIDSHLEELKECRSLPLIPHNGESSKELIKSYGYFLDQDVNSRLNKLKRCSSLPLLECNENSYLIELKRSNSSPGLYRRHTTPSYQQRHANSEHAEIVKNRTKSMVDRQTERSFYTTQYNNATSLCVRERHTGDEFFIVSQDTTVTFHHKTTRENDDVMNNDDMKKTDGVIKGQNTVVRSVSNLFAKTYVDVNDDGDNSGETETTKLSRWRRLKKSVRNCVMKLCCCCWKLH